LIDTGDDDVWWWPVRPLWPGFTRQL